MVLLITCEHCTLPQDRHTDELECCNTMPFRMYSTHSERIKSDTLITNQTILKILYLDMHSILTAHNKRRYQTLQPPQTP